MIKITIKVKRIKKILLAPSWRKSLVIEDSKLNRSLNKKAFETSEFYLEIDKLINSTELNELLQKEGYCLDVKLHPIFLEEGTLFKTNQSNIKILDSKSDFDINEYKLFVTDFSSFMFDFIQNKTKIVFLFPDYDRFVTGNHIYTEFDFDISQLGPKYTKAEELVTFIKEKITAEFTVEPEVAALYEDFYYPAKESSYRATVYKEIITIS
ncbi:hypothetical protein BCAMP_07175 [Brochothrix campestris FSL F6-1037]|uniref:Uncharacterized protein n=1 Tax=Brochothrix campestris FSL F6-1037 TaxID=1265861 RepID=W7D290_9LIST|nr:hypothetical protein BCAMP_07175 [Brochothrix campestris FSL F6-1037]